MRGLGCYAWAMEAALRKTPITGATGPPGEAAFIRLRNVVKHYETPGGVVIPALNGISFDLPKGSLVVIVGPSGAGKTTLLNLLGGMDTATQGEMWVGEAQVSTFNAKQLTEYRRHDVGFVFQFYNLMPNLTALENVQLAAEICRHPHSATAVLSDVGLAGRELSFPSQLSGGQQQRVSIARAIAKNSHVLLCDEPTGALDYETGKQILELLRQVCDNSGATVIIVTHNSALKAMADIVITMKNGVASSIIANPTPTPVSEIEW